MRSPLSRMGIAVGTATLLLCLAAGSALAGEVKGPPNQINNTDRTAAMSHANSACAASGLNDFGQGQVDSQVQTAADSWKYYELPKGSVGTWGLCRGGTGYANE